MDKTGLTPANENPWYILMTLYGEPKSLDLNDSVAMQNRRLWNAWICQGMSEAERAERAAQVRIEVEETEWTEEKAQDVRRRFAERTKVSGIKSGVPNPAGPIFLNQVDFSNFFSAWQMIFREIYFDGSLFRREVVFTNSVFSALAFFKGAHFFKESDFRNCIFLGPASFEHISFINKCMFQGSHFRKKAIFEHAKFAKEAHFTNTQFQDRASFYSAKFGNRDRKINCKPVFRGADFQGQTLFENADFVSHFPVLTGASLNNATKITADHSHWPKLPGPLNLITGQMPFRPRQSFAEVKESAGALRHAMARQALPEEEHFFFRREMYAAARCGPWLQGLFTRAFFELPSNYGYSIARPVWFLAAVGMLGALFYWLKAGFDVGTALGYSFANMFKFFGLQRTVMQEQTQALGEIPWGEPVAAAQTVLAFILLFFLGLGLRTRFRLR